MPAGRGGMQLLKQGVRDGLDNRHTGYLIHHGHSVHTYLDFYCAIFPPSYATMCHINRFIIMS